MNENRFLAVDQGNSFIKLSLFVGEKLVDVCRVRSDSSEEVFVVLDRWKPDCAAFCSVGRIDPRMVESLRIATDGNLLVMSHSTPQPIKVKYSTPYSLGLDRVVLAAGAASLYSDENVMIVDAGTAVTLDVIRPDRSVGSSNRQTSASFIGGRISPGLKLRMESLHQFTAALPMVNVQGALPLAGDSTDTCIRSGVILGLADEIVEVYRQYSMAFCCTRLVLTGGDAELLVKIISSRIPAVHVPDLMAKGLLHIYKYNETN